MYKHWRQKVADRCGSPPFSSLPLCALDWSLRRNISQFAENKRVGERAVVMPILTKVCFLNKATFDENRLASQIRDRSVRFEAMQSQGVECVCEHGFDGLRHDALSP